MRSPAAACGPDCSTELARAPGGQIPIAGERWNALISSGITGRCNHCVSRRYYAQAKAIDAASKDMHKDDIRRKEREVRERNAEQQMLHGMYRVSARA